MILLDLRAAGFVLLLLALAALLWRARRPPLPAQIGGAFGQVCDALPFGVVVAGADGALLLSNPAARRLLRALGGPADLLRDTAGPARSGLIAQPLALRWWRYPLDGQRALLVLADESEPQRAARRQQAFVGQLSHELRTPLTALVAHIEIARSSQASPELRQSSLETIGRETQRMARLVRDLLELHRLESSGELALQPANLALLAEDAIGQVFVLAEQRGLALTLDADALLEPALADPDRIKQVFLNVLDNAIKYCRPGDRVQVRLEARPDGVLCAVCDSGPGIAAAVLPHVAEPLYRASAAAEGNGLGLALVREILLRHRAELRIESRPGAGTTVSWKLPYATVGRV